jgi:photosystem II stability/assembly factor-like uncharacterized protein
MKTLRFRILAAALAALLPACGGGGNGSGGTSAGGSGNPAFPVTMTEPTGGQTFTAPATITLSAGAVDPASVATLEFVVGVSPGQDPNTWVGGNVVATLTQPPFQATWADMPPNRYSIVARATDSQGAQTFSNNVTISVLGAGESPGGWVPVATLWNRGGRIWFVDADRGWVAGVNAPLMRTVDGGATWVVQQVTPAEAIIDIQFIDANRGWALGESPSSGNTVLRTTDGGTTWTPSSIGMDASFFGSALSFVDSQMGWVVGGDRVFVTKDGGATWTPLPTGISVLSNFVAVHFVDSLNGWVLGATEILHTTDGGLTWTLQNRPDPGEIFGGMAFVSATTGWVGTGHPPQGGRILVTNDGGATWTEQSHEGDGGISTLDFVSPTQGWGGGGHPNTIIHTEDGGATWVKQHQTIGSAFFIRDVRFIDANRGWAVDGLGLLYKTTTGGKSP